MPHAPETEPETSSRSVGAITVAVGRRSLVYAGRAVIWILAGVMVINFFMTTLVRPYLDQAQTPTTEDEETIPGEAFPGEAAAAFAAEFAELYLQDGADAGEETGSATLADYVGEDQVRDFESGLSGDRVRVVRVRADDDHHGVVTLSARIQGDPLHLEVPVYADSAEALVVSGLPALLAAPAQATLPSQPTPESDSETADAMEPVVEGFLASWSETPEHLDRYTAPNADITPLPDGFALASLDTLTVPPGEGEERQVQATVTWTVLTTANEEDEDEEAEGSDDAQVTQRYELTMTSVGGSWYVSHVQGAATTPTG